MITQAGSRISDPNELKTLKESDIARVGKNIYRRDLAKEQEFAKTINTKSPDFLKNVYQNNQKQSVVNPTINITSQETPKIEDTAPKIYSRDKERDNIIETFKKYTGEAGANKNFIQGVVRYATGKNATPEQLAEGGTLADVVDRYGIGEEMPGYGITEKTKDDAITKKDGTKGTANEKPQTAQEQIVELMKNYGIGKTKAIGEAQKDVDLTGKSKAIATAQTKINNLKTILQNQQIIDIKELDELGNQPISNAFIQRQQQNLTRDQKLDLMITQNDYNNALVEEQIAQGNYDRAQDIAKQTADTFKENYDFQLQALETQGAIDQYEAQLLRDENNLAYQRMKDGYIELTPEQVQGVGEYNTVTAGGKTFLKPKDEKEEGWEYVATPAKRDELQAQGYELMQYNGRTYAREKQSIKPEVQAIANQIASGEMNWSKVPSDLVDDVAIALGDTPIKTKTKTSTKNIPEYTPEEKKFMKELESERKKLARGGSWASSWNYLKNRYPEATNQELDDILEKDKYYTQTGKSSSSNTGERKVGN